MASMSRSAGLAQDTPTSDVDERGREVVFDIDALSVSYSGNLALKDVTMEVRKNFVTAFIQALGLWQEHVRPLLQSHERPDSRRRGVGARPLPRPGSLRLERRPGRGAAPDQDGLSEAQSVPEIYENVNAFGPRVLGMKADLNGRVERALRQAALWDEVKDRLKENALGLSGGRQRRLCIARAIAIEPDVILMDEPASALDPISTSRIEDLIHELKRQYTIVIVTHNMQQAARVADMTAFFSVELRADGSGRHGVLVEHAVTTKIFTNPADKRTEDYVTGRFG